MERAILRKDLGEQIDVEKKRAYASSPDLTKDVLAVRTVDYKRHSIPL